MKKCTECKQIKDLSSFYFYKNRHVAKCKDCLKKRSNKWRTNNPEARRMIRKKYNETHKKQIYDHRNEYLKSMSSRFKIWKNNAETRGLEWTLTVEDLKSMPLICFYTKLPLTLKMNQKNTISLDRINSDLGYTMENVVFCTVDVNRMKLHFSKEYFIETCKKIASNH